MTMNVGTIDRLVRVAVGLALISLAFFGPKTAWGYIGFIPFLTGVFSFCPIYTLLGLNTCNRA